MTTVFPNYSKWLQLKMEVGDETSEETIRYAFLLGSALRNEDSKQFFQVYDAILPKDLPVEKVNLILFFNSGVRHMTTRPV